MRHIKHHIGVHHISTKEKFLVVLGIMIAGFFAFHYLAKAYPEFFGSKISVQKTENIRPNEPIVIDFSLPVLTKYYESKITVSPAQNIKLRWEKSNGRLLIVPENFWQPETRYEITLPAARNVMLSRLKAQKIIFSSIKYPEVASTIPENGFEDVSVDMEEPMIVNFKEPISDFYIKFTLNSQEDLSVQKSAAKNQFKLLPKNGIAYSTEYNLKIYAKYSNDEENNFQQIYESFFTTAPPPQIVWDKDYSARLEQAKKYTRAKIREGKYIDINLTAQVMTIFENGERLDAFLISSGKRGMDTPKGQTQIYNKFPRAYSSAYGLYMPYWMALTASGKFGIHELPEWPSGYKEGANHLGIPVSHGCVRLGVGPAEKVYGWAEIGTPVVVY